MSKLMVISFATTLEKAGGLLLELERLGVENVHYHAYRDAAPAPAKEPRTVQRRPSRSKPHAEPLESMPPAFTAQAMKEAMKRSGLKPSGVYPLITRYRRQGRVKNGPERGQYLRVQESSHASA